jgi:pSer/pThr/pTyr-binding forkhead associated (FHA) protein
MAVTLVVLSGGDTASPGSPAAPSLAAPSLTLDAPRIVLGRGEGCEVRLPETTVSHRHASIRQRGGEHVLVDENSANGTFIGRVRLPPQTPRALRSGERIRLGRVWLEVRFEPALVKGSTAAAAKELALGLVTRGLRAQGEDAEPRLRVVHGASAGTELVLAEAGRTYAIGKSPGSDLVVDDPDASRRHATVLRRADVLVVTDCGTTSGTRLDDQIIQETLWRPGQILGIGSTEIAFEYPAVEALAELERSPDERMPDVDVPEPERAEPEAEAPPPAESASSETPEAAAVIPRSSSKPPEKKAEQGGWGALDSAVILLALAVLAVSLVGALWLFGR